MEIIHNQEAYMIAFQHPDGARINVYYKTRTVGILLDEHSPGKTQLLRHNCCEAELAEIFKQPTTANLGHGYQGATAGKMNVALSLALEAQVNVEEDFRNRLLELDKKTESIQQRKKTLWNSLEMYEARREQVETKMKRQTRAHAKFMLDYLVERVDKRTQQQQSIKQDEELPKVEEESSQGQPKKEDEAPPQEKRQTRGPSKFVLDMLVEHKEKTHQAPIKQEKTSPQGETILYLQTRSHTKEEEKQEHKKSVISLHALDCDVCGKRCKSGKALKKHMTKKGHWLKDD